MVKAICVEVCLPVINDVMGSNAHVVLLLPLPPLRGEFTAQFACETKGGLVWLLSPVDLILFPAACTVLFLHGGRFTTHASMIRRL